MLLNMQQTRSAFGQKWIRLLCLKITIEQKKRLRFSKEIENGGVFNEINCQWMLFDSIKNGIIHFCTYVNHAIAAV